MRAYCKDTSRTIPLEDVPELWVDFYQNLEANDEEDPFPTESGRDLWLSVPTSARLLSPVDSRLSERHRKNNRLIQIPNKAKGAYSVKANILNKN